MTDLKAFRKSNDLTQQDLADILGVSRSFVAQVESGHSKLPEVYIDLLKRNEYDTTMLYIEDCTAESIAALQTKIGVLTAQLEEARAERDRCWELIKKLTNGQEKA